MQTKAVCPVHHCAAGICPGSVLRRYLFEEFKWRQVGWAQQKPSFRLTATPPISILHSSNLDHKDGCCVTIWGVICEVTSALHQTCGLSWALLCSLKLSALPTHRFFTASFLTGAYQLCPRSHKHWPQRERLCISMEFMRYWRRPSWLAHEVSL